MSKNVSVWLIEPQTNLHVGNESVVSFGVIDKAIQRDVTTTLPCINSSSLKGAVKEYLTAHIKNEGKTENGDITEEKIKECFGSVKSDKNGDTQKGSAVFFDAQLLAIPEQNTNNGCVYTLAYCEEFLNAFVNKANTLGATQITSETIKEQVHLNNNMAKTIEVFKELCDDESLPIIARNCLENGESVNLWYEQVLPAKSVLAAIIATGGEKDLDFLNGKIVQIGANATIGYGYCKFVKL